MFRPGNETEELLLSILKDCENPIKQTHWKPQETLENNLTQPRETFSFKPTKNLLKILVWSLFG